MDASLNIFRKLIKLTNLGFIREMMTTISTNAISEPYLAIKFLRRWAFIAALSSPVISFLIFFTSLAYYIYFIAIVIMES